jgi:hypothetical protein
MSEEIKPKKTKEQKAKERAKELEHLAKLPRVDKLWRVQ